MTFAPRSIALALCCSIVLHLGALLADFSPPPPPPPPPVIEARIVPPPAPPRPAEAPLEPPKSEEKAVPPPEPPPAKPNKPAPANALRWEEAVRKQLGALKAGGLMYSREAIAAGLEGTPVVLAVLDEDGNVTAVRIEESSGFPLLDRDALAAARRLRYLPADTPREVVLPIRFRLK